MENTQEKRPALVDVSVLLLFFNRADTFQQVFQAVREARPARLFLYQDGPRSEADMTGIEACRSIAEQVDWQCEVHRKYQQRNYGCDPSEYIAQKWAFSLSDKCIVLEDDDVPSQSFFTVCKELLDRYGLVQKVCEDNKKIYRDVLIYRSDYKLTPLDRLFIDELNQARKKYL